MFSRKVIALSLVAVLAVFAVTNQNINAGHAQDDSLTPDAPLGTSITYQGMLTNSNDNPINGSCDFRFSLYDALSGGTQVGAMQEKTAVTLVKGSFTVVLDFGSTVFTGEARWMQVAVRCPASSGSYNTLSPRQALTAAPYASYSPAAGNANLLDGADSSAFASATHNHWGENWSGDGDGLTAHQTSGADYSKALWGNSTKTGPGITIGVGGDSYTYDGMAVVGHAGAITGTATGGWFWSDSPEGRGVVAYTTALTGTNYGVYAYSASIQGTGVYGEATAASGATYGVYGQSDSTDGYGTVGYAIATTGVASGVAGRSDSPDGHGVFGLASATSGWAMGVQGQTDSTEGVGVFGYASTTSGNTQGMVGRADSAQGTGVLGWAYATNGFTYGVYGKADSPDGYGVYYVGGIAGTGLKSTVLDTKNFGWLNIYSVESPEVLFEDVGIANLVDGVAIVVIDPKFAETVNLNIPYQVFLTPRGDCGLYLAETTPTSFTVRALGGVKCSLAFDYRIIAKRLGYEDTRMTPATDPYEGFGGDHAAKDGQP